MRLWDLWRGMGYVAAEEVCQTRIAHRHQHASVRADGRVVHRGGELQALRLRAGGQAVQAHGGIVVGEDGDDVVEVRFFVLDAVDRDGVYYFLADRLHPDIRGAAEEPIIAGVALLPGMVDRQCAVHLTVTVSVAARPVELYRREVSVLLPTDADITKAAGGTARFEGQSDDAFALFRGRVQAVDVVAGGVVEEVGLGVRDIVAQLPMSGL